MKPFQNPYVVGGLAVIALALIFRNAIAPLWGRLAPRATPTQTQADPTPAPAVIPVIATTSSAEAPAPKGVRLEPELNIDLAQVGWKSNSAPRRDPFQITPATITNIARLYPAASELLALHAIWWQSGSILAAVNNRVVREGEVVYGTNSSLAFTVSRIGAERIWVDGPSGIEQVPFDPAARLRGISMKLNGSTNDPFAEYKLRPDWPYRIINNETNDADHDAGWATFSGKVVQKLADGEYLVQEALGTQLFILHGVPVDRVDDETLPRVRCKYVGTKSYTDPANAKKTVRFYEFGTPCSPPEAVVKSLNLQKRNLADNYADAMERRIKLERQNAENGSASAQYMLGRRYLYGDGVPKDETAARRWLDASAAQGNADARAIIEAVLSRNEN